MKSTEMDCKGTVWDVEWTVMAQDRDKWRALVNKAVNSRLA